MEEFTIYVKNRPGSLAHVCDVLYRNGVNVESLATEGTREDGTIKMITTDVSTTKRAFDKERIKYTIDNAFVVKVLNRPGELVKVAKKLAAAGISVVSIYLLGEGRFAIRVDNAERLREVLKDNLIQ